jgi:hypothetical protein
MLKDDFAKEFQALEDDHAQARADPNNDGLGFLIISSRQNLLAAFQLRESVIEKEYWGLFDRGYHSRPGVDKLFEILYAAERKAYVETRKIHNELASLVLDQPEGNVKARKLLSSLIEKYDERVQSSMTRAKQRIENPPAELLIDDYSYDRAKGIY